MEFKFASKESSLRFVEFKFLSKESSLRFVEFKFAFRGIQVCVWWNQVCFWWNQVCVRWNSSLHQKNQVCVLWNSSLRFEESSLRFVNSSFYRKNRVFESACELHRTRYTVVILNMLMLEITEKFILILCSSQCPILQRRVVPSWLRGE